MLIRVVYDCPVEEVKAQLRAKVRPKTLDNMTKDSSTLLYRLRGNLVTLEPHKGSLGMRFIGVFHPMADGKTKLIGIYGASLIFLLAALPALAGMIISVAAYWREPLFALLLVGLCLLSPGGMALCVHFFLRRQQGDGKERICRCLQQLGEEQAL